MIAMSMKSCIEIVLDILYKHAPGPGTVDLYLNLNSLLVIRQNDNPSPGPVPGGNFPLAFTKEMNLHTIFRLFRTGNQRITYIPVPDSPRKEAIFIGIFTSRGYLQPGLGAKSENLGSVAPPGKRNSIDNMCQVYVYGAWKAMLY